MKATETRNIAVKERVKRFEENVKEEMNRGNGFYDTELTLMVKPGFFERFDRVKHLSPTMVEALSHLEDMGYKISFRHNNEPNHINVVISW